MPTPQDAGGWFKAANAAVELLPRIGPVQFAVLMVLAKHAGPDRRCWPSVETIAKAVGIKRRAAQIALAGLRDAQAVRVVARRGSRGQTSNGYLLAEWVLPGRGRTVMRPPSASTCAPPAHLRAHEQDPLEPDPGEREFDHTSLSLREEANRIFHELLGKLPRRNAQREDHAFVEQVAWLLAEGAPIYTQVMDAFAGPKMIEPHPARPIAYVRESLAGLIGHETLAAHLRRAPARSACTFTLPLREIA